jgi:hypothetical protein
MPTSELTGVGDNLNSQRLQVELSVFETVQSIMCVPNYYADFAYVRSLRCSRDGLHVDLRFENPISSKVSIYHNYPWMGIRSVPYDNDTGNYSDPRALPCSEFGVPDSDLDAGLTWAKRH